MSRLIDGRLIFINNECKGDEELNDKTCKLCGQEFTTNRKNQLYCKTPHEMVCFGCNETFMLKKPRRGQVLYSCGNPECRMKLIKHTTMERYGVENAAQSKEVQDKMKKTTFERYGVEHAFQSEIIKEKMKATNIERYGTVTPRWHNEESRLKAEEINLNKYGAINPFGSKDIQDKIKSHNLNEYGVPWSTQADEVKAKMKETFLNKYGVDNPAKAQIFKDKVISTNMRKYGSPHFMKSEKGKKHFELKFMEKHGVNNPSHMGINNYEDYVNLEDFLTKTDLSITELAEYFNLPRRAVRKRIIELELQDLFEDLYVKSVKEEDFVDFLRNDNLLRDIKYIRNDRTILNGKEVDFYFPEHNLAIEISPTYTHNSKIGWGGQGNGVSSTYHFDKFIGCLEKSIELLTVFDWHDWDKITEMIKSKLQGSNTIIYARKTVYNQYKIISKELYEMVDSWHVLSLPANFKRKNDIGTLEYDGEIVGIAIWEISKNLDTSELKRLVFKPGVNIPGGASKLISNYIKTKPNLKTITTFSDCDLGSGNVYDKIGFELIEESKPVLTYYNIEHDKHIKHLSLIRQGADRLLANFPNYKPVGMGEGLPGNREIIESYNFLPVYDCGYRKWRMKI